MCLQHGQNPCVLSSKDEKEMSANINSVLSLLELMPCSECILLFVDRNPVT